MSKHTLGAANYTKGEEAYNRYMVWALSERITRADGYHTNFDLIIDMLAGLMDLTDDKVRQHVRTLLEEKHPDVDAVTTRKYSLLFNRVIADEVLRHFEIKLGAFMDVAERSKASVKYNQIRFWFDKLPINNSWEWEGVMGVHSGHLLLDYAHNEMMLMIYQDESPVLCEFSKVNHKPDSKYAWTDEQIMGRDPTVTKDNICYSIRRAVVLANLLADFIKEQLPQAQADMVIGGGQIRLLFRPYAHGKYESITEAEQIVDHLKGSINRHWRSQA